MKRTLLIAVLAAAVSTLLALPVGAAKIKPTLAVAPSAPQVSGSLVFSGCGYQPGSVEVVVESPFATSFFGGDVVNGCFSTFTIGYTALEAGAYHASAYQSNRHHADASLDFTVVP
jgi:hypothetical protein